MQAVILAGGLGTRLRPLTLNIPKPMIEVNGQPFLAYIIRTLRENGVTNIVLCVGYMAEKFEAYFGDGREFGVKIVYSIENEFLGTAGAIKLADNLLDDQYFVLNGDTYLSINYKEVWNKFVACNKMGLMVVYDNSQYIAEGNIAIDEEGDVIAYDKKELLKKGDQLISANRKCHDKCGYVDAGVYVFKKELLSSVAKGRFISLEGDIYPELIKRKELRAFVTSQRYYDLGTPERLELIRDVLK